MLMIQLVYYQISMALGENHYINMSVWFTWMDFMAGIDRIMDRKEL